MLNVESINVSYGDLQVLWDVSFKVEDGEIVAILGSNGAGKTTILNTIMGLVVPKSGVISFMGENVVGLRPHKVAEKGIGIVPEGRRLFPYMSVLDNILIGAYSKEVRKSLRDNLEWIFDIFPILRERKNQLAWTLSGGEQQMLAVARSLVKRPKLLLLDEISLGLAPLVVFRLFETIVKLNKENGISILLVEQNVREALSIADRGYVLENGRVTLEGSGEELLANEYVKRAFLGVA